MVRFFIRVLYVLTLVLVLLISSSGCHGNRNNELPANSTPLKTDVVASSVISKTAATKLVTSADLPTTTTVLNTTTTAVSSTTLTRVSTTQKPKKTASIMSTTSGKRGTTTVLRMPTTTVSQTSTTEFPIDPDTGKYKVQIPPIHFHYDSTDYQVFYDAIAKYCGPTITDKFIVRFHNQGSYFDPNTKEKVIYSYYLNFGTEINGCRSSESFHFSFDLVDGIYVCKSISINKPPYDPSKVKPPRKLTAKEEKAALKRERERVLKMPYNGEKVEDNYQIKEQEIEYFYDIEEDRNYYVITTLFLDDVGLGDSERAEFEIER